jgi:hypothetical protein
VLDIELHGMLKDAVRNLTERDQPTIEKCLQAVSSDLAAANKVSALSQRKPTKTASHTVGSSRKRNKGGRPRKWEALWAVIRREDQKKPKRKDQAIANTYNREYSRSIADGKMERANDRKVVEVRRDYGKRDQNDKSAD